MSRRHPRSRALGVFARLGSLLLIVAAVVPAGNAGAMTAAGGARLWVHRYNGPGNGIDHPADLAVSQGGSRVFVTGTSVGSSGTDDFATAAYDSATGAQLWLRRYDAGNELDEAVATAVSPDGARVFVTGESNGPNGDSGIATVAYDATTGQQLWVSGYLGPLGIDGPAALGVSPDGSKVFVTGLSNLAVFNVAYVTIAVDAATGRRLWLRYYDFGGSEAADEPAALAVSPGGSTVFVTGESYVAAADSYDYATVAYDAVTGVQRWVSRYDGPAHGDDEALAMAVSPGGSKVFVSGDSFGPDGSYDIATVAYDAATGAGLGAVRYAGASSSEDNARSIVVSPGGSKFFVTGSTGTIDEYDYLTLAYDAATGKQQWMGRYDGPGDADDFAFDSGMSPGGSKLFVTGWSAGASGEYDYATLAYSTSSGKRLWVSRYDGPAPGSDEAIALGVSPDGSRLFVTGESMGTGTDLDYATVAYSP